MSMQQDHHLRIVRHQKATMSMSTVQFENTVEDTYRLDGWPTPDRREKRTSLLTENGSSFLQ